MPGSIVPLPVMLEELDEQDRSIYDNLKPPTSIVVRYGYQKLVAELPYDGEAKPGCGSKLVIRTERGIEIGEMLTTTCPNSGCYKSVSRQDMLKYIDNSGGKDYPFTTKGKVLRVATVEDLNEQSQIDETSPSKIAACKRWIQDLELDMKLVEIEQLLGQEKILFYYTAPDRVDFRDLIKELATELNARIEMVQVNEREEARLVADYEKCGMHCCCKNFLKVLKPISMRSAKIQKATLDPQKISGRCGRLMCCLRYEDETYDSLRKKLPHKKSRVVTEDGEGIVLNTQILTQLVLVLLDTGGKPQAYPLENIQVLPQPQSTKSKKKKNKPTTTTADESASQSDTRTSHSNNNGPHPSLYKGGKLPNNTVEGQAQSASHSGSPVGSKSGSKSKPQNKTQYQTQHQTHNQAQNKVHNQHNDANDTSSKTQTNQTDNQVTPPSHQANTPMSYHGSLPGEAGIVKRKRRRRRRPRPGQPLQNHEVESKEGTNSADLPQSVPPPPSSPTQSSSQSSSQSANPSSQQTPQPHQPPQASHSHPKSQPNANPSASSDPSSNAPKKRRRRRRRKPSGNNGNPNGSNQPGGDSSSR